VAVIAGRQRRFAPGGPLLVPCCVGFAPGRLITPVGKASFDPGHLTEHDLTENNLT
jgi:hypothetical protein